MASSPSGFIDVDVLSDQVQVCMPCVARLGKNPDLICDLGTGNRRTCTQCKIPDMCQSVNVQEYPMLRRYLSNLRVKANEVAHTPGRARGTSGPTALVEQAKLTRDIYTVYKLLDKEKRENQSLKRKHAVVICDDQDAAGLFSSKHGSETSLGAVKEESPYGATLGSLRRELYETQTLLKERETDLEKAREELTEALMGRGALEGERTTLQAQVETLQQKLTTSMATSESFHLALKTEKQRVKKLTKKNDRLSRRTEALTEKHQQFLEYLARFSTPRRPIPAPSNNGGADNTTSNDDSDTSSDSEPLFVPERASDYQFRARGERDYHDDLNGDLFDDARDRTWVEKIMKDGPKGRYQT
ncbi:hypothetical protein ACHAQA_002005 [Verticillium albo-atrum]